MTWADVTSETGYTVQWSSNGTTVTGSSTRAANSTSYTTGNLAIQVWYVRVGATNALGTTWSGWVTVPAAP